MQILLAKRGGNSMDGKRRILPFFTPKFIPQEAEKSPPGRIWGGFIPKFPEFIPQKNPSGSRESNSGVGEKCEKKYQILKKKKLKIIKSGIPGNDFLRIFGIKRARTSHVLLPNPHFCAYFPQNWGLGFLKNRIFHARIVDFPPFSPILAAPPKFSRGTAGK